MRRRMKARMRISESSGSVWMRAFIAGRGTTSTRHAVSARPRTSEGRSVS